jgi:chemotaxis protein CheD
LAYDTAGLERIVIHPGEHRASASPVVLTTLLGSCVAACLYDPGSRVAGLNHFLLAAPRYARDMPITHTEAGRYGINAMELLINEMVKLGARRKSIKAKVFGGGSVVRSLATDKFLCVSEQNQRFIREFMATEGMELVSADLGGDRGRVINFHTDSYKVFRKFITPATTAEIEAEEHRIWERKIAAAPKEGEVILF